RRERRPSVRGQLDLAQPRVPVAEHPHQLRERGDGLIGAQARQPAFEVSRRRVPCGALEESVRLGVDGIHRSDEEAHVAAPRCGLARRAARVWRGCEHQSREDRPSDNRTGQVTAPGSARSTDRARARLHANIPSESKPGVVCAAISARATCRAMPAPAAAANRITVTPQMLMQALLVFVLVAPLAERLHWGAMWVFVASSLAIVPLAWIVAEATEKIASRLGAGVGGLLNATFGNAAELIIALVALEKGLYDVVKASLTGSIIGNILLVLGISMLAGGLRRERQKFDRSAAAASSTLLALAA